MLLIESLLFTSLSPTPLPEFQQSDNRSCLRVPLELDLLAPVRYWSWWELFRLGTLPLGVLPWARSFHHVVEAFSHGVRVLVVSWYGSSLNLNHLIFYVFVALIRF